MNTIAQCSATFIAITAGFFTTKMISLSTERSRIQRKKSEIESQLLTLKQKETRFNDKREDILMRYAIERVDQLTQDMMGNPLDYNLLTPHDLINSFEKYHKFDPTDNHIKILTERSEEIIGKWRHRKNQEEKRRQSLPSNPRDVPQDVWALIPRKSDIPPGIQENGVILFDPLNYKTQISARFQFEATRQDTYATVQFVFPVNIRK